MQNYTKRMLGITLIALSLFVIYRFWDVALMVFAAIVVSYLLNPLARLFERKLKIRHGAAVFAVLLLTVLLIIAVLSVTVPYIAEQISNLNIEINGKEGNYEQIVRSLIPNLGAGRISESATTAIVDLLLQGEEYISDIFATVLAGLLSLSFGIFDAIIFIVLLAYFMLDSIKIKKAIFSLLPESLLDTADRVTTKSNALTKKYIRSRLLISLGMSITIYIGFAVMKIKYAPIFAILSFVMDFVPYFGSVLAGIIETFYVLVTVGWQKALAVLIFVLIVQQLEGNVIAPRVEGNATGIHPIIVIISLLCCQQIFGPVGMLISTPLAAIAKTVLVEVMAYIKAQPNTPSHGGEHY